MAYKDFVAGQTLTAAEVDTYLMRQTVMTFADSAARDTALSGVLVEGMVAYLRDQNRATYYTGSAWLPMSGRVGGRWSRVANQSATGSALTTILWDTESEDTDNFSAPTSGDITIPSGLGGLYIVSARLVGSTNWTAAGSFLRINMTSSFNWDFPSAGAVVCGTAMGFMAAASVITVQVNNADATKTVTGQVNVQLVLP